MSLLADEYRDRFGAWLDAALPDPLPERVAAFVLVLYEGGRTFDAQIAGTAGFDTTDSVWVRDQLFSSDSPPLRHFAIDSLRCRN